MASMATLMLAMENSVAPSGLRQLDVAGTCAPTNTPVRLLRNDCKSHPACSQVSQVQVNSIRTCGSADNISWCDIPKRLRSKSFSPSSRINPSYALANRPGPENSPMGR